MTPLQACLTKADELIGSSRLPRRKNQKKLFDPVRAYVEMAEGQERRRVFILVDAAIRIIAPMALELDFPDHAATLRALPEITSRETASHADSAASAIVRHVDLEAAQGDRRFTAGYAIFHAGRAARSVAQSQSHQQTSPAWASFPGGFNYDVNAASVVAFATNYAAIATDDGRARNRPWLALRDAMLRAACLDGACCIHPECRGKDEEGVEGCSLMYPDFGRACLIEADPLGVRRNPTEMSTGTAALAGAAVGAVLGGLLYMLMPKNVSKESA